MRVNLHDKSGVLVKSYDDGQPDPVAQQVTPRQFRLALLNKGINPDAVKTLLDGLEEPTRTAALIEWEYAIEFKRDHPLMDQMGQAMGKTATDIDAIFNLAAKL